MGKYSLQDFNNIIFTGFEFKLEDEVIKQIQELASQVGSPTYIKTPVFQPKGKGDTSAHSPSIRKRRENKHIHDNSGPDDWGSLHLFSVTKLEPKVGLEGDVDLIRSYLNKITDKNYTDMKTNIITMLDKLIADGIEEADLMRVSISLFEFASTNRFFSKLYADLYTELVAKYEIMNQVFETSFKTFLELFNNIEYTDPDEDYDEFCKNNKTNEKRKALSAFFVNLCSNNLLAFDRLVDLTYNMVSKVMELIPQTDKKPQVDEYTENIAILYNDGDYAMITDKLIDGLTISETIKKLATSKTKTYPSLSSKCIFKYMDLIDM